MGQWATDPNYHFMLPLAVLHVPTFPATETCHTPWHFCVAFGLLFT
jgi:hypothetical protein